MVDGDEDAHVPTQVIEPVNGEFSEENQEWRK